MHDTKNPPGQFRPPRYLRDEIKRIQETIREEDATYPSTDAEKRLERLKTALLSFADVRINSWCVGSDEPVISKVELQKIISENA